MLTCIPFHSILSIAPIHSQSASHNPGDRYTLTKQSKTSVIRLLFTHQAVSTLHTTSMPMTPKTFLPTFTGFMGE